MIQKVYLFFILFCLAIVSHAQVMLSQTDYDFGELRRADQNWVDIEVRNESNEEVHIFRIDAPKNVTVLFSNKSIQPRGTETIRLTVSPLSEGSFKLKLPLHLSAWSKPETITLTGTSTYVANGLMPCPDFDNPGGSAVSFHVSVQTENGEPFTSSMKILAYKSGQLISENKPNDSGEASFDLPNGRYLMSIRSKNATRDTVMYVSHMTNHLVITLPNPPDVEPVEIVSAPVQLPPETAVIAEKVEVVKPKAPPTPVEKQKPEPIIESPYLPESKYKQNNLVFLVDVSTSMKRDGKLDLLKVAMVDLLDVLRPTDRFTLISYASESNLIIQTVENLDKDACMKAINDLSAGGDTEGARALDAAGKAAIRNFVEAGNNQIFLATDGAFNQEIDKAIRIVNKYKRKDVVLSVVGIKCGPFTTKQMTQLAEEGNGKFLPINDSAEAGIKLVDEVKRSALK